MIEYTYTPVGFENEIKGKILVSHFQKFYNQECYVREALSGVFGQTYSPIEIIISDDCSVDGTHELIMRAIGEYEAAGGKHKVIYNRNEVNLGIAGNAEACIMLSSGEICVQSDGDDVSLPNRVERIVEAFSKFENVTLVDSACHTITPSGGRCLLEDWSGRIERIESNPNAVAHKIPCFIGAVLAYRRSALLGYDKMPADAWVDDIILSYRACLKGPVVHIDEPLVYYRVGAGISTARTKTLEQSLKVNHGRMRCFEQLVKDIRSLCCKDLEDAEAVMENRVRDFQLFLEALGGVRLVRRTSAAMQLLLRDGISRRNLAVFVMSLWSLKLRGILYELFQK